MEYMDGNWTLFDHYERRIGRWSRLIAPEFLSWSRFGSGRRGLDIGCGSGALTEAILRDCAPTRLEAVDAWDEAVQRLSQILAGDRRVSVSQGDAHALEFPDSTFDIVVSGLVLNGLKDPPRAVQEMRRVTIPGGMVAGYVWDFSGKMEVLRFFWDAAIAVHEGAIVRDQGKRFPLCHEERMAELFVAAGLEDVATTALDATAVFADFGDYWSPFVIGDGSVVEYMKQLSAEHREAIRQRLDSAVKRAEDGTIRLEVRAWAVRGRVPAT